MFRVGYKIKEEDILYLGYVYNEKLDRVHLCICNLNNKEREFNDFMGDELYVWITLDMLNKVKDPYLLSILSKLYSTGELFFMK